jgi:hypothetical protein
MNTPRNASGSPERANAQGPQVDSLEGAPTDAESTTAAAGTFPANDTATMFRRALVRAILSTLDASTRAALLSALGAWLRTLVLVCVDGGALYDAERAEEHASQLAPDGVAAALVAAWSGNSVCELHAYATHRGDFGEHAFVLSAARVALGDIAVMLGEVGEVDGGRAEGAAAVTAGQGGEHAAFVAALLEYAAEHEAPALALDAAYTATRDTGAHAATMLLLAAEHVCEHGATLTRSPGRSMGEPSARERELCAVYMRDVARLLTLASKALDTTNAGRAS